MKKYTIIISKKNNKFDEIQPLVIIKNIKIGIKENLLK